MKKIIIKKQTGFTLIELMIAVAIIGVLAAIAIPQYQIYVVKAKLTEAIVNLEPLKLIIDENYYERGVPLVNIGGALDGQQINNKIVGAGLPKNIGGVDSYWAGYESDIIKHGFVGGGYAEIQLKSGGAGGLPTILNNTYITMVPRYSDPANLKGELDWICAVYLVPFKYLPTSCHHNFYEVSRPNGT